MGSDLRRHKNDWTKAEAVAHETMERVRTNVDRLIELLPAIGYEFTPAPGTTVHEPPAHDVRHQLDGLEERIGVLPLALRAWYEDVGEVSLIGRHPRWTFEFTDALIVQAPIDYIHSEYDQWEADRNSEWRRGKFTIDLSPDYLHKANVSGGAPYAMSVPNEAADGLLLRERHQTTFVNYLRVCFSWAGFPGWERGTLDGWAAPPGPPPGELTQISASLLSI